MSPYAPDHLANLQGRTYGPDKLLAPDTNWYIHGLGRYGVPQRPGRGDRPWDESDAYATSPQHWGEILSLNEELLRKMGYTGPVSWDANAEHLPELQQVIDWMKANGITVGQSGPLKDGIARHGNYYTQLFDTRSGAPVPIGQGYRTSNDYAEDGMNIAKVALAALGGAMMAPASGGASAGTAGATTGAATTATNTATSSLFNMPGWQTLAQNGLTNAGVTALRGGDLSDILKSGVTGVATGVLGGLNVGGAMGLDGVAAGIVNGAARGGIAAGVTGGNVGDAMLGGAVTGGIRGWNPASQMGITDPQLAAQVNRALATAANQAVNGQDVNYQGLVANGLLNYGAGLLGQQSQQSQQGQNGRPMSGSFNWDDPSSWNLGDSSMTGLGGSGLTGFGDAGSGEDFGLDGYFSALLSGGSTSGGSSPILNPALIDSALGTSGYGQSSAGPGGNNFSLWDAVKGIGGDVLKALGIGTTTSGGFTVGGVNFTGRDLLGMVGAGFNAAEAKKLLEARQAFEAAQQEKDRTWRTGESDKDRTFRSGESSAERAWRTGESDKDRALTAAEKQRDREFQEKFRSGQWEREDKLQREKWARMGATVSPGLLQMRPVTKGAPA